MESFKESSYDYLQIKGWKFERVGCNLTAIPDDIPDETVMLYLDENLIEDIRPGAFEHLPKLEYISLYHNRLTELRVDMFRGLSKLRGIHLYVNKIAAIEDDTFANFAHMKTLSLEDNELPEIRPGMFVGLDNLQFLNLRNNRIASLPAGVFSSMPKLYELDLGENQLTEVTGAMFEGLDELQSLILGNNRINSVKNMIRVGELSLTKNHLETLEADAFLPDDNPDDSSSKMLLKLAQNPFQCDERLCWLKEAEERGRIWFYYWGSSTSSPSCQNYPGVTWKDVDLGC